MSISSIQEIDQEIRSSSALKAMGRIHYLSALFEIFHRNYSELRLSVISTNNNIELWSTEIQPVFQDVHLEITRRLHNFLASAMTLVDSTRVVMKESYSGTQFHRDYQAKVDEQFKNVPLPAFIQDLRNYSLHRSIPLASGTLLIERVSETDQWTSQSSVVLEKSLFLNFNWKAASTKYLAAAPDSIPVLDLIDEYYKLVYDFRRWLNETLMKVHAEDMAWLRNKQAEFQQLLLGGSVNNTDSRVNPLA